MKIKLARSSGFCMGVRRAMEMAIETIHSHKGPIYSYGPLIHNPQAVALLESKGLRIYNSVETKENESLGGTVIIRAHGLPPNEFQLLKNSGLEVIDATCPRVIKVQNIIKNHSARGYQTIIWGHAQHPEVIGLLGYADGGGYVINGPEDVPLIPDLDQVILVAQTTQNKSHFTAVESAVKARWPGALIFDTICGSTQRRQDEVRQLAREVSAMIAVGGHDSGNTRRLAGVAEEAGIKTLHIETEAEITPEWLSGVETVGVTAGASTPNWMIKRVIRHIDRLARKGDTSLVSLAYRVLRILLFSNLYISLGAGTLGLAGAMLQGVPPQPAYFGITFFYVHAMHLLNLFLDKEASHFNDPDRAFFLEGHKGLLLASGVFSAITSLGLSLVLGRAVFIFLIFVSTLGLLYAVPLVPRSWSHLTRFRRLKDIPLSKTLSLSGGWAICLGLVPVWASWGLPGPATFLVIMIIFLLVLARSALGDLVAVQGDRIVGRETIPIILGEKKTLIIIRLVAWVLVVIMVGGWSLGWLPSLALFLLPCAAFVGFYQSLFRWEPVMRPVYFEAIIDANFILAGLLSWLWAIL